MKSTCEWKARLSTLEKTARICRPGPGLSTQFKDHPEMFLPTGCDFRLKGPWQGYTFCFFTPEYSYTFLENTIILLKISCSSQRLHNEDSEQNMYLIECLVLDRGWIEIKVFRILFRDRRYVSGILFQDMVIKFFLAGKSPLFLSKLDSRGQDKILWVCPGIRC